MKKLLLSVFTFNFLVLCISTSNAQWQQTNIPSGIGKVQALTISGTNIFAGTSLGGIFLSTDNGNSWNQINNGLTNTDVRALVISGTTIFAGTGDGVFLSSDIGNSWTQANNGITKTNIQALAVIGNSIFAAATGSVQHSIYQSDNNGTTWTMVNNGADVQTFAVYNSNIYAGTFGDGILFNNGNSWTRIDKSIKTSIIYAIAVNKTSIFVGGFGGLLVSTNNGSSWTQLNYGIKNQIKTIILNDSNVFAGTDGGGVVLSVNNGTNWAQINNGLTDSVVGVLTINGTEIYAGTNKGGVWKRPLSEIISSCNLTTPTIATGSTILCQGDSVTLFSSIANSYLWSNGATTPSITVKTAGNYTLTVKDNNNCTATSAVTTVTVNPIYSKNTTLAIYKGDSIMLGGMYRKVAGTYTDSMKTIAGCDSIIYTTLSIDTLQTTPITTQSWNEKLKVVASDSVGGAFGWSVSVSGNYAIVGARTNGTNALGGDVLSGAGAAYMFERDSSSNWIQKQKIVASDRGAGNNFGYSVFISGDYAIVGAYLNSTNAMGGNSLQNAGAAYIFERDINGKWMQTQKIVASDRSVSNYFGCAVSISGKNVIVGARNNYTNEIGIDTLGNAGAAYLFERNTSGVWTEKQKIVASNRKTSATDYFGFSVSISNNYAIIGAPGGFTHSNPTGAAYLFEQDKTGRWVEKRILTPSTRTPILNGLSDFASFVAISGDYTLVGGESVPYLFERDSLGVWKEKQKLVPSDEIAYAVAISGDYALVGCGGNNKNALGTDSLHFAGAAFLFKKDKNGNWIQQQKIVASDRAAGDKFGSIELIAFASNSLAISGNNVLIGALGKGAAYFFETCVPKVSNQMHTICAGQSLTVGKNTYTKSGTYTDTLTSYQGCDSTVTTILTVLPANTFSQTITKCAGQSLTVGKNTYIKSGTYTDTLTSYQGCDSTVTTNLIVLPANTFSQTITKCAGQSLTVGKNTYTKNGTYTDVLTSSKGCDSTVTSVLTVLKGITFFQKITKCAGQSLVVGKNTYTTSGAYYDTLAAVNACDSLVITSLTVLPANAFSQTITKCAGQSVTVGKNTYTKSGTYTDVLTSYKGCDSTVTTNLTVLSANTFSQTVTKCAGQSLTIGKNTYTKSGTYTDVLISSKGCDSTITTNLTVLPANTFSQTITKCAGQSVAVGNNTYSKSGTYTDVLTSSKGCDSTVTTNLTVLPANTFSQTKAICSGESVRVGNSTYTKGGTYTDVLISYKGCDSMVTTIITIATSSSCELVWSGDANHDGVANNFDLLAIGVAFGKSGAVRSGASLNWVGQPAANWADTLSNGTNYKHADCNGDGAINAVDTTAIILNYGFTHNKIFAGNTPTPSDPTLSLNVTNSTVKSGVPVKALVELGTSTVTASNAYGIAFTVNFDPALVDSATLGFDVVNSWLGTKGTNVIALDYTNFSNGSIDLAITKIDHNNANGFGTIGELTFTTSKSFTGNKTLNLSVSKVKMISNNEMDLPVNVGKDAVVVTGVKENELQNAVRLYPNPAQDKLFIEVDSPQQNFSVKIFNALGMQVYELSEQQTNKSETLYTVDLSHQPDGVYFAIISNGQQVVNKKVMVVR